MWVFEENYRLLAQLLPDWRNGACYRLPAEHGGSEVEFRVLERHRYTAIVELQRLFGREPGAALVPDLSMQVRAYDDAAVAEVLTYQDCTRIPPRYAVGEGVQYQRDEKRQVNALLYELLRYCARRRPQVVGNPGYSPV
ncbi:MAG TPA: DUF1249 domain-containing protein [Gammaproteobacteria bacterium]|nr:DUF1249 domain-containing protein [Gammaproteobacteria bacterium]